MIEDERVGQADDGPALEERIGLELVETRTFGSRVVYLRYRRA